MPKLTKWPFFVADAALMGLALWLFSHYPHPLAPAVAGLLTLCVILAALLALWPIRLEYQTAVKAFESDRLTNATEAIGNLEDTTNHIRLATGQWQNVQEHATRTTDAAREIADRMTAEARAFSEFMGKAGESEKATLRLEIDKLRRSEGQWLQVVVHLLDHVHALYQAGARSGQPSLASQLGAFQAACRDLARRVGLAPIEAAPGQAFDPSQHDLVQGQEVPAESIVEITQIVATGFTYQGQVLRRPIVVVKPLEDTSSTAATNDAAIGESPVASQEFEASAADASVESIPDPTNIETVEVAAAAEAPEQASAPIEGENEFRLEADGPAERGERKAGHA